MQSRQDPEKGFGVRMSEKLLKDFYKMLSLSMMAH